MAQGRTHLILFHPHILHVTEHPPHIERSADKLAEDRSCCRSSHAHIEKHDQDIIQHDIEDAGEKKEIKRMP